MLQRYPMLANFARFLKNLTSKFNFWAFLPPFFYERVRVLMYHSRDMKHYAYIYFNHAKYYWANNIGGY